MKNFIAVGNRFTLIATVATVSGAGLQVGSIFGVAENTAAIGESLTLVMNGIFDLPKPGTQAWTLGQTIYWDSAVARVTNVVATNIRIGIAVLVVGAGAGETTGRVRLNGAAT